MIRLNQSERNARFLISFPRHTEPSPGFAAGFQPLCNLAVQLPAESMETCFSADSKRGDEKR